MARQKRDLYLAKTDYNEDIRKPDLRRIAMRTQEERNREIRLFIYSLLSILLWILFGVLVFYVGAVVLLNR